MILFHRSKRSDLNQDLDGLVLFHRFPQVLDPDLGENVDDSGVDDGEDDHCNDLCDEHRVDDMLPFVRVVHKFPALASRKHMAAVH